MAKKVLTPEQAEIKAIKKAKRSQNWTKFWAIFLAAALTLGIVSMGKYAAGKITPATDDTNNSQSVDGDSSTDDDNLFGDDGSGSGDADTNGGSSSDGASSGDSSSGGSSSGGSSSGGSSTSGGSTSGGSKEITNAEVANLINDVTAKASKGNYHWHRVSDYTEDGRINLGSQSAKDTLDKIIAGIAEGENVDSVVGGFLGIGTKDGDIKGGQAPEGVNPDRMLKATSLKAEDIKGKKISGNVYQVQLASCKNPQKDGSNALSRATNDFFTHDEVVKGIADFTTAIKVNSTDVTYSKILLVATIDNNKLTNFELSYEFAAKLQLKAVITINGSGKATNHVTYSNITY